MDLNETNPSSASIDQRLQLLVEAVVDYGIFLLDPDGRIVSWNSGAQKLKGWTREEILGRHFSIFYPPDAVARGWPDEELRRAIAGGRFEDEGWRVRKDGTRFWANVVITALHDPTTGELAGFAKVTRDLTERRRHEEELTASEERLRLLVDSISDHAVFMLDAEGRIQSWNRGAELINGYTGSEIVGKHFSVFFSLEDRRAGKPARELEQARNHGVFEDEGWRIRKDGSRFWGKVVVRTVYGRDGELVGFAKVTQDLSLQRRLEEMEQSTQRTNEFLAMLAHELRNPLAPIRNAVTILQKIDAQVPEQVRKLRDIIDRQAAQLTRLVDDLLDVSRLATGKIKLRHELVDIGDVVARSIETARPLIEARRHQLEQVGPSEHLLVDGDSTRLAQVLQNLLVNAAKYTPEGGQISVSARRTGNAVEVAVQDNGRGIAPHELDRIFELFAQGDGDHAGDSGLGVGLALARALVQMHGGSMKAQSEGPGRGSTFSFRLPLAPVSAH
ncbi:sensor histidine kinase [Ramlibacter henchirensis]|nr:PAS domain-containing sensor histidine kinase [Ramlibacter henchirensis]